MRGRKTFEEDNRRACPIDQNPDKIPDEPDKKGILYIMVDGAAVDTRLKDEQGSSWRENKLGLVFSSADLRKRKDGVTHDILKKEYIPCLGSAENFKKYLLECAVRNGYGRYEQTIPVSDGASWIRNMVVRNISGRATDTGLLSSGGKHLQFWKVSFS
jgi:hypothetical protein